MGWCATYGLGRENQNLPAFVVMVPQANALNPDQPLFSRLWGSGFLSSRYQGVKFRSSGDAVLYLSNPPGVPSPTRRRMLDGIAKLNRLLAEKYGDPEIDTRVAQYAMAYHMQTSLPDLMDLSKERESTFELYGPDSRNPGTYAANYLRERRLADRGVRFIHLYHPGGDPHTPFPHNNPFQSTALNHPPAPSV